MKKLLAIVLSLLLIIAPVYSYAILPFVAATAATMTRALVGNMIKKPVQTAVGIAGMGFLGYCKSSAPAALSCLGLADMIYDLGEDWIVEEEVAENGDINIEIYQLNQTDGLCTAVCDQTAYSDRCFANVDAYTQDYLSRTTTVKNVKNITTEYGQKTTAYGSTYTPIHVSILYRPDGDSFDRHQNLYPYLVDYTCPTAEHKTYMDVDQFYNAMQQNLTANDMLNIYNYDYSQHPNITINNNTTSGDTINNNLRAPNADDKIVSDNLKDDIESNKVNMDEVNEDNCTIDLNGIYTDCLESPADDEQCTELVCNEPDPDTPAEPEEEQPVICSSNALTQKFCNWMDWTKEAPAKPVNTEVEIVDPSQDILLDKNRYSTSMSQSCPSDSPIPISTPFGNKTLTLKYSSMCEFLAKMSPFNEAAAYIASVFIVTGIRPRGGENG